jgi:hypothetical protein
MADAHQWNDVCVLGIPKGKFSKEMKNKYLVTELYGLSAFFPEFIDV